MKRHHHLVPLLASVLIPACTGEQSSFSRAGAEAASTLDLFWLLSIGSAAIFIFVLGALAFALAPSTDLRQRLATRQSVVINGIAFPMVVLCLLLVYGFAVLDSRAARSAPSPLRISVEGNQWWWRVTYQTPSGGTVESANELRLPIGKTIKLDLTSSDVIHSFWIPGYAGKVDMIPGRTNTLTLNVEEAGELRGQCAEYCGGAHALMAFRIVSMDQDAFDTWLAAETEPAEAKAGQNEQVFLSAGCGACHTVRGTSATGTVGPDLTHVAMRRTIGAATLPATRSGFLAWMRRHKQIKPGNLMPEYDLLTEKERTRIADYLETLD